MGDVRGKALALESGDLGPSPSSAGKELSDLEGSSLLFRPSALPFVKRQRCGRTSKVPSRSKRGKSF